MTSTKAFFQPELGAPIPCLFNPSQLSITRSNTWTASERAGRDVPTMTYAGAKNGTMSFEVFFDTTDTGKAVTEHTDALMRLMNVDVTIAGSDEDTGKLRPQTVVFNWGSLKSFEAIISSLTVTLNYFSPTGVPLRAKVPITLTQYKQENLYPPQNPTSGTPWPHGVHRVAPGETLDRIAAKHFADPNAWRRIAEANDIDDPLTLRPGTLLAIPGRQP